MTQACAFAKIYIYYDSIFILCKKIRPFQNFKDRYQYESPRNISDIRNIYLSNGKMCIQQHKQCFKRKMIFFWNVSQGISDVQVSKINDFSVDLFAIYLELFQFVSNSGINYANNLNETVIQKRMVRGYFLSFC